MTIKQAELWLVNFNPKIGSEVEKIRPAIVISHNTMGKLPLRTVVPITDYKKKYAQYPWMLKIAPTQENNLTKLSSCDCFQIKSLSTERFVKKIGLVDNDFLKEIHKVVTKTLNPLYELT